MSNKKENKILLKITALGKDSVKFTAIILDDNGRAHFQKRESTKASQGFMSIDKMVREVAKVGDYVYYIRSIVPGSMTSEIVPVKDLGYYEKVIEDYENGCLRNSYSSYIRDYKLNTIIDEK